MKFRPDDFVKFLENIDHYLKTDINFLKNSDKPYPVGLLDDVYIEFVHYHSETEVLKKWIERKNRINWNNVCYIACDGGMSENAKKKYLDLPINNKVLFTADPFIADSEYSMYVGGGKVPDYKRCSIVYAGGSHDSIGADARLLNFCSIFGHRYYNRLFDYVNFLNSLK